MEETKYKPYELTAQIIEEMINKRHPAFKFSVRISPDASKPLVRIKFTATNDFYMPHVDCMEGHLIKQAMLDESDKLVNIISNAVFSDINSQYEGRASRQFMGCSLLPCSWVEDNVLLCSFKTITNLLEEYSYKYGTPNYVVGSLPFIAPVPETKTESGQSYVEILEEQNNRLNAENEKLKFALARLVTDDIIKELKQRCIDG